MTLTIGCVTKNTETSRKEKYKKHSNTCTVRGVSFL